MKGNISADLNLPDTIIDLNAIGFRTRGLCIGGERKHWFGFDFLKLFILIYVQLSLLNFNLGLENGTLDSRAFSSDVVAFDILTLLLPLV